MLKKVILWQWLMQGKLSLQNLESVAMLQSTSSLQRFEYRRIFDLCLEGFFIVQGFIGSLATEPSRTTVLPLDGSDVTAALIAACLSTIEKPVSLVYFKRGDPDSLYGFSNARKLMVYMKKAARQ
ncbi:MAG: hypothetical protein R3B65_03580 [Candidatus Paceibacterota bacterium]